MHTYKTTLLIIVAYIYFLNCKSNDEIEFCIFDLLKFSTPFSD